MGEMDFGVKTELVGMNKGAFRLVGNIWCVGAGKLISHPKRGTNLGNPVV